MSEGPENFKHPRQSYELKTKLFIIKTPKQPIHSNCLLTCNEVQIVQKKDSQFQGYKSLVMSHELPQQ